MSNISLHKSARMRISVPIASLRVTILREESKVVAL
jgi:hypothetical protein